MKLWTSAGGESPHDIDFKNGAIHLKIDDTTCTLECDLTNKREISDVAYECFVRHQLRMYSRFQQKLNTFIDMKFKNKENEGIEI